MLPQNAELYTEGIRLKELYEDESIKLPKREWFRWVINQATTLTGKKKFRNMQHYLY